MKLLSWIFSLTYLATLACLPVVSCPSVDPANPDGYSRRSSPNRCEGVTTRTPVSGDFSLVSFASRNINRYGDNLEFRVPNVVSNPSISIRDRSQRYRLNNVDYSSRASGSFIYRIPSGILRRNGIALSDLRATASAGNPKVFVPIIFGSRSSGTYEFIFSITNPTRFKTFQISRNGQAIYSAPPRTNFESGEARFSWNARNAPAGRYQLRIVVEIRQRNRPLEEGTLSVPFEHNPRW